MQSRQHVEVPSFETEEGLEFKDLLIYAHFRKYMDSKTKQTFVSVDKIVRDSGISKPTILKALKRLEKAQYFIITKKGKSNLYTFLNNSSQFEIFGFEFLNDKSITNEEKATLINQQHKAIKDKELNKGIICYTDRQLAKINHIDIRSYKKYKQMLLNREVPLISLLETDKKDPETGLPITQTILNFDAYNTLATGINIVNTKAEIANTKADIANRLINTALDRIDKQDKQIAFLMKLIKYNNINIEDVNTDIIL